MATKKCSCAKKKAAKRAVKTFGGHSLRGTKKPIPRKLKSWLDQGYIPGAKRTAKKTVKKTKTQIAKKRLLNLAKARRALKRMRAAGLR